MARYPDIEPYETGLLDTGDGNLVYWETCGNPGGKPTLVLHGGPGLPWTYLEPLVEELAPAYAVATYQQRGLPPSTAARPYDVPTQVADVVAVLDALGWERPVVAGHSWGGHLLLHLLVTHPERLRAALVLDPLGGRDWRKGLKLLRPGGRLVAFGFANLARGERRNPAHVASQALGIPLLTPLQLISHNRTVSGVNLGHLWGEATMLGEELQAVLALWDAGRIKPRIDSAYPFAEVAAAQRRILRRQNIGKIVLIP